MTLLRLTTCALAAVALMGATFSAADEASAQEKKFISIGTGGPTGVYFVVGNSVCRMVHKEAAEGRKSGRKHGIRCAAHLLPAARLTTSVKSARASSTSASPSRIGSSTPSTAVPTRSRIAPACVQSSPCTASPST